MNHLLLLIASVSPRVKAQREVLGFSHGKEQSSDRKRVKHSSLKPKSNSQTLPSLRSIACPTLTST